jgi:hypothetical protein
MYRHCPQFSRQSFSAFASATSIVATPSSDVVAEPAPEPLSTPSEPTFLVSVSLALSPAITPLSIGNVSEPEHTASSIPPSSSTSYSLAPPSTIDVHEIASAPPAFLPLILYSLLGNSSLNPKPEPPPCLYRTNPLCLRHSKLRMSPFRPYRFRCQCNNHLDSHKSTRFPSPSKTCQSSHRRCFPQLHSKGYRRSHAARSLVDACVFSTLPMALLSTCPDHSIAPPSSPSLSESISQPYMSCELESTPAFSVDLVLLSPSKLPAESSKTIPIFPTPFEVEIIPIPVHSSLSPPPHTRLSIRSARSHTKRYSPEGFNCSSRTARNSLNSTRMTVLSHASRLDSTPARDHTAPTRLAISSL